MKTANLAKGGNMTEFIWKVAVWWPQEGGYGMPTVFDTEQAAMAHKDWLESPGMGYGKPGAKPPSEVHVWMEPKDTTVVRKFIYRGRKPP